MIKLWEIYNWQILSYIENKMLHAYSNRVQMTNGLKYSILCVEKKLLKSKKVPNRYLAE